jgi:hypothetical protein
MHDALASMRARRALRVSQNVTTARSCDGCDLCCSAPGIKELHKEPGDRCLHLSGDAGRSCSIYRSRPKVCIDFHCLWRITERVLPGWLRPADCGFLLAFNRVDQWPSVVTVHVDAQRPDAWRNPWAMTVFGALAEQWNCLVAIHQAPLTSHIFCPNGSMMTIADYDEKGRATLVREDGFIGAPEYVFGPDRRPLIERLQETSISWGLPPPPWASGHEVKPLHDDDQRDE